MMKFVSDPNLWFAAAIQRVRALPHDTDPSIASFLDPGRPVTIARAPGRLDVMGGIADYSGSLVLEMPLACATFAIAQAQDDRQLDILSFRGDRAFRFAIAIDEIVDGPLGTTEPLAEWFAAHPQDRWAAYVVGAVHRCLTSSGIAP